MRSSRRSVLATGAALMALPRAVLAAEPVPGVFASPEDVTIAGYDGDAMEPFITRDGKLLLFNNRNDPGEKTDIYWAERVDDTHFTFRGPLVGANAPNALDGVPSLSSGGDFVFVSTRSYGTTSCTLYRARFANGAVSTPAIVEGVSRTTPGWVNFDVEISADGNTLYYVDGWFGTAGFPQSADLMIATRDGDRFVPRPDSAALLAKVNTSALEYAAAISTDERELFFTRVAKITPDAVPAIFRTTRPDTNSPFGPPEQIAAITGFAEAPSLSPDGKSLYFHARIGGKFVIRRVTR